MVNQVRRTEAARPAAAKVGGATDRFCLMASMSSNKRRGEESIRLTDRILKLEDVDRSRRSIGRTSENFCMSTLIV